MSTAGVKTRVSQIKPPSSNLRHKLLIISSSTMYLSYVTLVLEFSLYDKTNKNYRSRGHANDIQYNRNRASLVDEI